MQVNACRGQTASRLVMTTITLCAGIGAAGCGGCPGRQTVSIENPLNGATVSCTCDGACVIDIEGHLCFALPTGQSVHVAVRPLVTPDIGFFIQQTPASDTGLSWEAVAELGSAEFPPQKDDSFELKTIVVDTSEGDVPVGPFDDLSSDTIPGLIAVSNAATVTVRCGDFEARLFDFLDQRQSDSTGCLPSFDLHDDLPEEFKDFLMGNPAFLYDNALAALAYFARGTEEDVARAGDILDCMLAVQKDRGAFPDAINVVTGDDIPIPDFGTGNQMWAVLALLKGYEVWKDTDTERALSYLGAAEAAANFVLGQKNDKGCGGFVLFPGDTRVSTEHNADAYAAFSRLADVLASRGEEATAQTFRDAASHARIFVECMFDPVMGKSWTGTSSRELVINKSPVPEDAQTWTLLSLGGTKWIRGLEWVLENLWTTAESCPMLNGVEICGPAFSDADLSEVWFEGVGHVWVAAQLSDMLGHAELLRCPPEVVLEAVQLAAPHTDGCGIVAACGTLNTGFGFSFFNTPAVAPTAWAIFGSRGVNPFWDVSVIDGLSAHPRADAPWVALDVPTDQTYSCNTGDPCVFEVSGSSSGVAGVEGLAIHVIINPTLPSAGVRFIQFPPADVGEDGSWTAAAQLGSADFPAADGDRLEVSAIIVDGMLDPESPGLNSITLSELPELVATSGILQATVSLTP